MLILILIIGFGITACGNNDDDKKDTFSTAKYRFSGNKGNAGRALVTPNVNASIEIQGAEEYENFYSQLGEKKGSITPTMFELAMSQLSIYGTDDLYFDLLEISDLPIVDLAKPILVNAGEIKTGHYKFLAMMFSFVGMENQNGRVTSRVSFPKPDGFDYSAHAYSTYYFDDVVSESGDNIIADLFYLEPLFINNNYSGFYYPLMGGEQIQLNCISSVINQIFMGGDNYRIFSGKTDTHSNDIVPGIKPFRLDTEGAINILVPFSGINIPEDAETVRFEICWDIEGIIERYEGYTNSPNDDIFVIKNRFWEAFSIQAFIE